MGVEIAINVTPQETRAAVLDKKVVTELYVDRARKNDCVGNVYKGKVVKVLPGMQAAFIDVGLESAAFLHVADLSIGTEPGDILVDGDEDEKGPEFPRPRRHTDRPIEELLEKGQDLIVQISKGPIGTKGPRVTSYCSLPGRFLVLMPTVDHIGVSRRIADDEERGRLREILKRIREPGYGYIVRTVSEGVSEDDLKADVGFLNAMWEDIVKKQDVHPAPVALHTDLSLTLRVVRDLFTKNVSRLLIDSKEEYETVKDFVRRYLPGQTSRIFHYHREEALFDHLGIEMEIARALTRKVWLKSGGHIVIDHTEAMTVIDVNTGRYVGKRDREETILKNNLEAAREIAYQIKLRGIGGLITVDFIDMARSRNRDKVYKALVDAMADDKARTRISRISDLGLIEISRERVREDLLRTLSDVCVGCDGRGYTRSAVTVVYDIFRDIRRIGRTSGLQTVVIGAHAHVVDMLRNAEHEGIEHLQRDSNSRILVHADPLLALEQYDIVVLGTGGA
ncbi:MAG: Rne/Rng family ribonuclease [Nitrospira sp.]|nr:Rne/Rng family ribonuclease [Nitrospira sp.]